MNDLACLCALLAACLAPKLRGETNIAASPSRSGFYVWQRHWSDEVDAAVRTEIANGTHDLYILGGELEFAGTNATWACFERPARLLQKSFVTVVLRLSVRSLDNPQSTAGAVVSRIQALGAPRVQLDVDAPVSKMNRYGDLLEEIRRQWPADAGALHLGATFLPCHLSSPDMRRILSVTDEPVIQLHGIDAPKKLGQKWGLMNRSIVFRALKDARCLDARFKMALPSYAYILTFRADGSFRRLYAEGLPDDLEMPPGTIRRVAAPDQDLICEIFQSTLRLPVIWFRLPVRGSDRWCLDRETLLLLERGERPVPRVEFFARRGEREGVIDLFACYRHQIPLEGILAVLDWGEKDAQGEFFPLNGCRLADDSPYGKLPRLLSVPPSPCGNPLRIGTVISNIDPNGVSVREQERTR